MPACTSQHTHLLWLLKRMQKCEDLAQVLCIHRLCVLIVLTTVRSNSVLWQKLLSFCHLISALKDVSLLALKAISCYRGKAELLTNSHSLPLLALRLSAMHMDVTFANLQACMATSRHTITSCGRGKACCCLTFCKVLPNQKRARLPFEAQACPARRLAMHNATTTPKLCAHGALAQVDIAQQQLPRT